ncbi:protein THEMIS [Callorhinchus milii]|uniref:Protein THEMIS-like protein n=1 Tax=Callorhinchus milii TaxID=7868 RepID=V9KEP4_CALMI|nr:protein THEMIS [Callorhinchus milii]|eukprot:gi/632962662/ref/XP_007897446.1/ PREDICTED: protein THEMIS [Callorhinchus milii]
MALSLENFIDSVDPTSLPRILQIQSGIYFQGSVYEMHGTECCLATGEIIKVIGFKIAKIIAEISNSDKDNTFTRSMELPLEYPGLFKVLADPCPYSSVKNITESLQIGHNRLGHPRFRSNIDIQVDGVFIKEGEHIVLNSLNEVAGEQYVNCEVVREGKSKILKIPLLHKGIFYECEDDQFYTLKEIVEWKIPKNRKRVVKLVKTLTGCEPNRYPVIDDLNGDLSLMPIYEIHAVMKFRKDIVHIPSNLDVEVVDVTEFYDINSFVQPVSVSDIFKRPSEDFPLLAEIIEGSDQNTYSSLKAGRLIIIHKKHFCNPVIVSENRSDLNKRHFLIPKSYKGRFKRRPREFPTVYDMELASKNKDHLHVIATKEFLSDPAEFSSVLVGDQFLVKQCQSIELTGEGEKRLVKVMACERIVGKIYEQIFLPMYVEGSFVEVIHDKKQYHISEICKQFSLPFNVKVSVRDLSINDTLAILPALRIEEEITDPRLLVSLLNDPSECYELPVQRVNMSIQLLQRPATEVPHPAPKTIVEEISEDLYYMLRRYENATLHPPPRPPKKPQSPVTPATSLKLLLPEPKKPEPPKSPKNSPSELLRNKLKSQRNVLVATGRPEDNVVYVTNTLQETSGSEAPAAEMNSLEGLVVDVENLNFDDKHDYEYIDEDKMKGLRKQIHDNEHLNKKNWKKKKAVNTET